MPGRLVLHWRCNDFPGQQITYKLNTNYQTETITRYHDIAILIPCTWFHILYYPVWVNQRPVHLKKTVWSTSRNTRTLSSWLSSRASTKAAWDCKCRSSSGCQDINLKRFTEHFIVFKTAEKYYSLPKHNHCQVWDVLSNIIELHQRRTNLINIWMKSDSGRRTAYGDVSKKPRRA